MIAANTPTLQDLQTAQKQLHATLSLSSERIEVLKKQVYEIVGACMEVHKCLGPFLNEYMYQDALEYELADRNIPLQREYYFAVDYKGQMIKHKHYVDFMLSTPNGAVILECKAVERITDEHRQQLWNYMRLTNTKVGMLYNFAPVRSQCEKYYIDSDNPVNRYVF